MVLKDFPQSVHVRDIGLMRASDDEIWRYARDRGFVIVTLDSDFYDLSVLRGYPPRVIWLRSRNTSTDAIIEIFRRQTATIHDFLSDSEVACLVLKAPDY